MAGSGSAPTLPAVGDPASPAAVDGPNGLQLATAIAAELANDPRIVPTHREHTADWTWLQFELHDETVPLTVDILASNLAIPQRVIYMLPGGAANFSSSFLVPKGADIAHFFGTHGYLVVGITPREDNVPRHTRDPSFMAQWGMAKHREDIRMVVNELQPITQLPYEMLGHSYGAVSALDYAAAYSDEMQRVIALDIYSIDPATHPEGIEKAERTYNACVRLLDQGTYADTSYVGFKSLAKEARTGAADPDNPSYEDLNAAAHLTARGLLFLALIDAAPGDAESPLTGLPSDWPLASSLVASKDDGSTYRHTGVKTIAQAAAYLGSELISVAFERDYWSVVAANRVQTVDWAAITTPVIWMNTELGYNDQTYAATLIEAGGNPHVTVSVIPGYGHADVLWSETAEQDVWSQLVP